MDRSAQTALAWYAEHASRIDAKWKRTEVIAGAHQGPVGAW
jgi:hypothetical protein